MADTNAGRISVPKIAVLLCTCDSERYLREQMDSYWAQSHGNWELWVSDDGSRDGTLGVVGEYEGRGKAVAVVPGPRRGATANFLSLLRAVETDAEYFAWSDADDVWLPDKLERASRCLESLGRDRAALYCGRTAVVDGDNRFLHLSPLFTRPPAFRNALCQSIGGGNTMLFNRKARDLFRIGDEPGVFFHDWWAYMLVSGCGGSVHYDPSPCLRYRQHQGNLIGGNLSFRARLSRCRGLFQGKAREWNKANITALEDRREFLTSDAKEVLDAFANAARAKRTVERLRHFRRSGVFRQTPAHNFALGLATLTGAYP